MRTGSAIRQASPEGYLLRRSVGETRIRQKFSRSDCTVRGPTSWLQQFGTARHPGMPANIPELSSSPLRSEGQGASPVALSAGDDTREAWSCPLPNEIFTVGSQGRDEEVAGVGVAMALHRLLVPGSTPARHASQPLYPVPSCLPPHSLFVLPAFGRDGSLPSSMRRSCPSQGPEHLLFRSHSSRWIRSCLRRG